MVSKAGIRDFFSRHFLGRVRVLSVSLKREEIIPRSFKRNVEVLRGALRPRVVSPARFALGKMVCVSNGIKMKNFQACVSGGKVAKYASGEIKVESIRLKFVAKAKNWKKSFAALPQERRNRMKFIPEKARDLNGGVLNLAYFYPIIEDNVAKLVLNKQDGTLFVWYNPNARSFSAKGLFMCKRIGEREIDWRWVKK